MNLNLSNAPELPNLIELKLAGYMIFNSMPSFEILTNLKTLVSLLKSNIKYFILINYCIFSHFLSIDHH